MSTEYAIQMAGLTKFYGPHRGIEDIDLSIEPGQAFGFLGPNGSGKSTCMRVLLDFHRATRGSAAILGLDSHRDSLAIRRRVSYLSGDVALYEKMSALAQLEWLGALRGAVNRPRIEELAGRLDLDLTRRIGELSKGNRQKVGLVQAFMNDPELLILDEPTSGLDPLIQHTFQEMVREVVADGRTVFLSSHIIDEVDHVCDQVAIIREGRLVAVESIASLRARSRRRVRIAFDEDVEPRRFLDLHGVHQVNGDARTLDIRTTGDIDAIVKLAAEHRVLDLVSEQADLEEVFLAFYGGDPTGGEGAAAVERGAG